MLPLALSGVHSLAFVTMLLVLYITKLVFPEMHKVEFRCFAVVVPFKKKKRLKIYLFRETLAHNKNI